MLVYIFLAIQELATHFVCEETNSKNAGKMLESTMALEVEAVYESILACLKCQL